MPANPYKSRNTERKVLGLDPDLGEILEIVTLKYICDSISGACGQPVKCILVSDGSAFGDALRILEDDADDYIRKVRQLIHFLEAGDVMTLMTLKDFKETPCFEMPFESIQTMLDDIHCDEPKGILKSFVTEEFKCEYYDRSHYGGTEKLKKSAIQSIAEKIECRHTQFGIYVKNHIFKENMVRLSVNMHHFNINEAFPIRLVYGADGTPWHHSPIVYSDGRVELVGRYKISESDIERSENLAGIVIRWMMSSLMA